METLLFLLADTLILPEEEAAAALLLPALKHSC